MLSLSNVNLSPLPLLVTFGASVPTATIKSARSTGSKHAIAFTNQQQADAQSFTSANNVGWMYNWSLDPLDLRVGPGQEFVPLLWTKYDQWDDWHRQRWDAAVQTSSSQYLLGYNEVSTLQLPFMDKGPDQDQNVGGTGISAQDAAEAWKNEMQPHGLNQNSDKQFSLESPAISASGMQWMSDFMSACSDCEIDFFAAHFYGGCDNADGLKNWLQGYKDTFVGDSGKTVWLTEFGVWGCQTSQDEADYIADVTQWLDAQDWVERYAYFGNIGNTCAQPGADTGDFLECPANQAQ